MDVVKDYPPYLDYPKPHKAKTNTDRIRAMSDRELANLLTDIPNNEGCYQTIADWLQQPAKE